LDDVKKLTKPFAGSIANLATIGYRLRCQKNGQRGKGDSQTVT